MGCAISPEQRAAENKNKQIDHDLKKGKSDGRLTVKMLLLGAGESGKSTIAKQMRIIHKLGYSSEELESYRVIIYENIIKFFETIIEAAKRLGIQLPPDVADFAKLVVDFSTEGNYSTIPKELWECLICLWEKKEFKDLVEQAEKFHLNISIRELVDDIPRIRAAGYSPSDADILRSRVKTTGIKEQHFSYKDINFQMFDVGGQRSERRKWVHCFENVNALIFCASLSEYDQTLEEDNETNRMKESLKLFSSTVNNPWFENCAIILFLNKKDLFEEKIKHTPLTLCFPEYTGSNSYDDAKDFIRKQYEVLNKNKNNREIYTHFTCATDTNQMAQVFESITDIIMKKNLRDYGLY